MATLRSAIEEAISQSVVVNSVVDFCCDDCDVGREYECVCVYLRREKCLGKGKGEEGSRSLKDSGIAWITEMF